MKQLKFIVTTFITLVLLFSFVDSFNFVETTAFAETSNEVETEYGFEAEAQPTSLGVNDPGNDTYPFIYNIVIGAIILIAILYFLRPKKSSD